MSFFSDDDRERARLYQQAKHDSDRRRLESDIMMNRQYMPEIIEVLERGIHTVFLKRSQVERISFSKDYNTDHGRISYSLNREALAFLVAEWLTETKGIQADRFVVDAQVRLGEGTGYIFSYDVSITVHFTPPLD